MQIRPVKIRRGFTSASPGSVLYQAGGTTVLCTAGIENKVPEWMAGKGKGWITAEYNMLPHSTRPRKQRERAGKVDGRTTEIQRLIGPSVHAGKAGNQPLVESLATSINGQGATK